MEETVEIGAAAAAGAAKERPILFSPTLVRAILEDRKTVTRRVVTVPWARWSRCAPFAPYYVEEDGVLLAQDEAGEYQRFDAATACPYGAPGDRLWVRETHAIVPATAYRCSREEDGRPIPHAVSPCGEWWAVYRASWSRVAPRPWRPSIHMPRWASRITLEVTEVRVERVQDITEEDARAEGLACWTKDGEIRKWGSAERHVSGELDAVTPWADMPRSAPEAFAALWDSINARRGFGWAENPWVWVISFRRLPCGTGCEE